MSGLVGRVPGRGALELLQKCLPIRLRPATGGPRGEHCAPPSAPGGGHWGRRCTQRAAGHLRVGYRYNPLLACLEAWALGNQTSA